MIDIGLETAIRMAISGARLGRTLLSRSTDETNEFLQALAPARRRLQAERARENASQLAQDENSDATTGTVEDQTDVDIDDPPDLWDVVHDAIWRVFDT